MIPLTGMGPQYAGMPSDLPACLSFATFVANGHKLQRTMNERRRERRIDVDTPAVMTPLAAVAVRLKGQVINVSANGLKVRVCEHLDRDPRVGDVYRILSSRDRMLCEVNHCRPCGDGTEIGFKILHWSEAGELKQALKAN